MAKRQREPMFGDPALEWYARRFGALNREGQAGAHGLRFAGVRGTGKQEIDWDANREALQRQHDDIHAIASQITVTRQEKPKPEPQIVRRSIKRPKGGD